MALHGVGADLAIMYALLPSTLMNFMEKAETTEGQIKDAAEKQAQAAEASEAVKTGGISKDIARPPALKSLRAP